MAEQVWRPRFLCHAHRGPGRPGCPSAPTTRGRRRKTAGTVRMKGGESRPEHGPDEPVPGWSTPHVERRKAACLQWHAHRKVQTKT